MSKVGLKILDGQLTKERAYWAGKLSGELPVTGLPLDFSRPAGAATWRETIALGVEEEIGKKVLAVCGNKDSLAFTVFVATLNVILYKYTGVEDIIIGTAIHEQHGQVASFNKVLALRNQLESEMTVKQLLEQVRKTIAEAYANQKYPFDRILDALNAPSPPNRAPLFNVVVALDSINNRENVRRLKNDVSLILHRSPEAIDGEVDFNPGLFKRDTIEVFREHYNRVLRDILERPDATLSQLELLSAGGKRRFLCEFNQTERDYPSHKTIHQLFEEQAAATPERDAIVFESQRLNYREFNSKANQLAHHLQALGAVPGRRVGIYLDHSVEMLIGALGALKAGAAYVPLDTTHPKARLAFALEDAELTVVLTHSRLSNRLPACEAEVVCLDTDWDTVARASVKNPSGGAGAGDVAYVIYTSGSTGQPKGVKIPHRALVNYIWWAKEVYLQGFQGEILAFPLYSSLAFDLTVTSIFTPLITGNRIVIYRRGEGESPIFEVLRDNRVGILKLTPSHLSLIKDGDHRQSNIKRLIVGGEAFDAKLAAMVHESFGGNVEIFNEYGPTETTVGCMLHRYDAEKDDRAYVPIGRPASNVQLYVLDKGLNPVAENAAGELYISGDGLAQGYLNREELTAHSFVDNPFLPGRKMYRSGDLVRRLPEGALEYLGRADEQVKFHGHRVELNEVRLALNQHPQISDSAVVLRKKDGRDLLAAYYVSGQEPRGEELRDFLKDRLIAETIPNVFMRLERLPLTVNGKLDHRELPEPKEERKQSKRDFVAARTPAETILASIWAETLKVEPIGVHDNFFRLGGDSILSILVIAKAKKAGLHLEPQQIFQHQTIAELAAHAAHARSSAAELQTEQGPITGPALLTPAQQWFFKQNLSEAHHYNHALVVEARQPLEPSLMREAVRRLLSHHDALRMRFFRTESGWRQHNGGPGEAVPFTHVDLSRLTEAEQAATFARKSAELQAGFNLAEGLLMRVALFHLGPSKPHRVLVVIHHLVVDGVSWRILLGDLEAVYRQLSRDETVELPSKTTSLMQWAQRLSEYAQSKQLREEFDYWRNAHPEGLGYRVPLGVNAGVNDVASASTVSASLGVEETGALLQEVPKAYHTEINDALLTALAQAFEEWGGVRPLLVDLDGHGREAIFEDVDLSRTVGWLTSIFPVVVDLEGAGEPGGALKLVKERLRRIPNRGLGYGLLRYLSGDAKIVKTLNELPRAEVSFNYLGQFDQSFSGASLFSLGDQSAGASRSPRGIRPYLLEISASVIEGRLRVVFTYSENLHLRSTIESLANSLMRSLRSLIAHCASSGTKGYTPSDFPEAELSQEELNELLAQYGGAHE